MMYHFHFVKKGYILSDANPFVPNFKPNFVMGPSASTKRGPRSVRKESYGEISPARVDGTKERAGPMQPMCKKEAAPTAFSGCSTQRASKSTKRPSPTSVERSRVPE